MVCGVQAEDVRGEVDPQPKSDELAAISATLSAAACDNSVQRCTRRPASLHRRDALFASNMADAVGRMCVVFVNTGVGALDPFHETRDSRLPADIHPALRATAAQAHSRPSPLLRRDPVRGDTDGVDPTKAAHDLPRW